ncbi:hypothetical protein [Stenotrophomonas mori]|uniref:Translocation/assembly module TamB n=1 Tax=Stenotrophomonas mori TaxID=2871096 RepID=A0ABT0SIK5_9GAMM|nr:hypothetical protein [Stenotrophomonas mori]MCL7714913.1 hypothetical protein [Stenotrophomonas mori]
MNASPVRRALPWRALRLAGLLLVACYALYLLAGNVFLNSRIGHDLLNRKPEAFTLDWSGGRTYWPGRVTLHAVRMGGHVRRVQWSTRAETVRGRIALWPLLRRELRVPWVEADGVSGSVGRAPHERPAPPPRPGGWILDFPRIATDSLRAATLDGWQLAGEGRAEVGFVKQLRGGPMELRPSSLWFEALQVRHGDTAWLRGTTLSATAAMPRHVGTEHPGLAKLDLVDATLELRGTTVGLQSTLDAEGRYGFAVQPGEGRLQAALALRQGALARDGRLQLRLPLLSVDAGGGRVANQLDLQLAVDDGLRLRATLPDLDGRHPSLDAHLDLPGTTLPLTDWRPRLVAASGAVRAHGHLPSIGAVVALFAEADWMGLEGSGTVDADLRLEDGRLVDGSRLEVTDVAAHADVLGNHFSGKGRARAVIANDAAGQPQSRLEVVMDAFSAAPARTPERPYFSGERLRLETVSDARLERMAESMQARLRFERARIPDLTLFNPYLPNDTLRFAGGNGLLSGDLRLDGDGDVGQGTLRVEGRQVRLAVSGMQLRGDVAVDARLRRGNLHKGEFELGDSRASVRNVAFTEPGGTTHSGWWATLAIDRGRAEWKTPSSASGSLQVWMRDVGFLLAMFADRTDLPRWTARVVDAGEARLSGTWLWKDTRLVLDRAHAENARFAVDARLALEGPRQRGDLYLKWGVLGVGVELRDGKRTYHLRGARQWYDSQPRLLP